MSHHAKGFAILAVWLWKEKPREIALSLPSSTIQIPSTFPLPQWQLLQVVLPLRTKSRVVSFTLPVLARLMTVPCVGSALRMKHVTYLLWIQDKIFLYRIVRIIEALDPVLLILLYCDILLFLSCGMILLPFVGHPPPSSPKSYYCHRKCFRSRCRDVQSSESQRKTCFDKQVAIISFTSGYEGTLFQYTPRRHTMKVL
jgi:hypothetical protein